MQIYKLVIYLRFIRIHHTSNKSLFHLKEYSLPSPTKPNSASPSSSPEPSSSPNIVLNGKMEIGNQASSPTLSTAAAALSKITNFSIAAIISQQQNHHKLRSLESNDTDDDLRAKRRRLEEVTPNFGRVL